MGQPTAAPPTIKLLLSQNYIQLDVEILCRLKLAWTDHPAPKKGNPVGKEDLNSEQTAAQDTSEALARDQSLMKNRRIAKVMESILSPMENSRIGKLMEQFRFPLEDTRIAMAMEQFRSPLMDFELAKATEQFRSPLMDLELVKATEQFRSPLMDSQLATVMEPYRAFLQDSTVGKLVEQSRSALLHTPFGKLFQDSYSEAGLALAGTSVADLLEELKARRADFTDEHGFDVRRSPQSSDAEGHATASATATGDARVEKAKTQDLPVKTQDLSTIPTWFIRFILHLLLLHSIELIGQWEQIRVSVVDLNARLPQTESLYKIRNFIRTKLAGKPGDIRLVTGSDVNLRVGPGMKSEVILTLPKNAIVVVQGKEDRTWLSVSYELEGYWIDGYVSTKHLKKVRKN